MDHEVASYFPSVIKKKKEINIGIQLLSPFDSVGGPSPWVSATHIQGVSSCLLLNLSGAILGDTPMM